MRLNGRKKPNCLLMLAMVALVALCSVSCDKLGSTADDGPAPVIKQKYDVLQVFDGKQPDYSQFVDLSGNKEAVKVSVDSHAVNLQVTGVYPVTYTVTDSAGRSTQLEVKLNVYGPKEKVAFLTFDDGPSAHTPAILHILDSCGVKATFFVIAQNEKYLSYISDEHKAGHTVAAHSYTHEYNIYRSDTAYFRDLEQIEQVIKKYTGSTSPLVRMPGGSSNHMFRRYHPGNRNFMHELVDSLEARGYLGTDWNIGGEDARGRNVSVQRIVAGVSRNIVTKHPQQYLCVLMHDAVGKETSVQALPQIISVLQQWGYKFAPLTVFSPRFQQLKPGTRIK